MSQEPQDEYLTLTDLDEQVWEQLALVAGCPGTCFLDLSGIKRVTPAGAIGLLLFAKGRMTKSSQRLTTRVETPREQSSEFELLKQIDLIHLLRVHSQFQFVDRLRGGYDQAPPVPKLSAYTKTLIQGSKDREGVAEVMRRALQKSYPAESDKLLSLFSELINNIEHHTTCNGHPSFHCVQTRANRDCLELAFGDLGPGFMTTLARNPQNPHYLTDTDALRAAMVEGRSSMSHELEYRGGGLRRALAIVSELGGTYRVVSNDGLAQLNGSMDATYSTLSGNLKATMVWARLPLRAQA